MLIKEIEVEGYAVKIESAEGKFIVSVPALPGCIVQVDREEDAKREVRKAMGVYFSGLANSFSPDRKKQSGRPGKPHDAERLPHKGRK